jgi:hypothetical protein
VLWRDIACALDTALAMAAGALVEAHLEEATGVMKANLRLSVPLRKKMGVRG